jgi:heat shock protein HslJ
LRASFSHEFVLIFKREKALHRLCAKAHLGKEGIDATMKKTFITAAIFIMAGLFTAVYAQQTPSGEWTLTRMIKDDKNISLSANGKTPTIKFGDEGFSGNAGCNSYSGNNIGDKGTFKAGPVRSTKMACAPEVSEQENFFFSVLEKAAVIDVSDGTLSLSSSDSRNSLRFRQKSDDTPFLWIVDKKQVDCRGIVHQNCLQVKKTDVVEWQILRTKIEGFNYKPGKYYLIRVKRAANGYKLVKVISRTRLMAHVD